MRTQVNFIIAQNFLFPAEPSVFLCGTLCEE